MCHFCRVALLWCVSKDLTCRQPAQVTDGGAPVEHPTRRAARFSAQERWRILSLSAQLCCSSDGKISVCESSLHFTFIAMITAPEEKTDK